MSSSIYNWYKNLFIISMFIIASLIAKQYLRQDFSQYWASAKLIEVNKNPYSKKDQASIQNTLHSVNKPIMMWNPPLILPFISWLKAGSYSVTQNVWSFLGILTYFLSLLYFSKKYLIEKRANKFFPLITLTLLIFPPFLSMIKLGQVSFLLLLGLSLFLFFEDKKKHFLAGLLLSVTLVKPHSLYLLYVTYFAFQIKNKNFNSLYGFFAGGLLLVFSSLIIEPYSWEYYLAAIKEPPTYFRTTTLSYFLKFLTGFDGGFLLYLPCILCSIISLTLIFLPSHRIKTRQAILAIIPLSLFTAPYGWTFDQVVILPSIIFFINKYIEIKNLSSRKVIFFTCVFLLTNVLAIYCYYYHLQTWHIALLSFFCIYVAKESIEGDKSLTKIN